MSKIRGYVYKLYLRCRITYDPNRDWYELQPQINKWYGWVNYGRKSYADNKGCMNSFFENGCELRSYNENEFNIEVIA